MRTRQLGFLPLFLSVMLGACGGDEGLLANGSVTVEGPDLRTGFSFPEDVRIDGIDAGGDGRIRGTCEMNAVYDIPDERHYGIVVEMLRGFESDDDRALSSLTVMQRTDGVPEDGRVEVMLGTTQYASRQGECRLEVDYAADGMVGLTGACDVYDADGESVNAVVSLDLAGCTINE